MSVEETAGQWQTTFNKQRLPRTLEAIYAPDEHRLRMALPADHCFLVAIAKDSGEVLGYLTMHSESVYRGAWIHDVVVSLPYRRRRIGTRLVNVARHWAKEQGLTRITIENQTQNYPGITFCQQLGFKFCGYNDQYFPNHDIAVFLSQTVHDW
jgi:GNAT superfamily N-acetyltransferase